MNIETLKKVMAAIIYPFVLIFDFVIVYLIIRPLIMLEDTYTRPTLEYKNATVETIYGGDLGFEIIWQTLNYPRNIPMKHSTQKKIVNPINMYGMPFNISFVLSNALLNERLS